MGLHFYLCWCSHGNLVQSQVTGSVELPVWKWALCFLRKPDYIVMRISRQVCLFFFFFLTIWNSCYLIIIFSLQKKRNFSDGLIGFFFLDQKSDKVTSNLHKLQIFLVISPFSRFISPFLSVSPWLLLGLAFSTEWYFITKN